MNTPRPIGYWHHFIGEDQILPHPRDLVRQGWVSAEEKARLAAYLRSGETYEGWRGYSDCRFRCGIDDNKMGYRDFTDGVWVWPEGLHHYVEKHDVMLPHEFLAYCRERRWSIPTDAVQRVEVSHVLDHSFWIAWAKKAIKTTEQPGTGQPATRPVDEPEGGDKPQPEAEGRSR
jgi:hypothetical protein